MGRVDGSRAGIPVGAAAVALNRLGEDVADDARRIEATLALGATSSQAVAPLVRRSLRSGMITLVDSTKTTGLIFFPGTMVGMLLAGADPVDAVRLQLILLYTLLRRARRASGDCPRPAELLHRGASVARTTAALRGRRGGAGRPA